MINMNAILRLAHVVIQFGFCTFKMKQITLSVYQMNMPVGPF